MSSTQEARRCRARNVMAVAVGSAMLGGLGLGAAGAQDLPGNVSITGTVFNDEDGNGVLGGGEEGLAGVQVELRDLNGDLVAVTATGSNGVYAFTDLEPGTYTVVEVANPAEFPEDTTDASVVVDANEDLSGVDFGNASGDGTGGGLPGSVQAQVFGDANRDGALDFSEADRIAGAQVRLLTGNGSVLAQLITDSFGLASFTAPEGTIEVFLEVSLPAGLEATTPLSTFVRLEAGQVQTVDIGAVDPDEPTPGGSTTTTTTTTPGGGSTTTTTNPTAPTAPVSPDSTSTTSAITGPGTTSTVAAPAAPVAPSAGTVALPVAPSSTLSPSAASGSGASVVLGERASAASNVTDPTQRRVLAATGRDSSGTASRGALLLAGGAVLMGAGSLLRRTGRPSELAVTGTGTRGGPTA